MSYIEREEVISLKELIPPVAERIRFRDINDAFEQGWIQALEFTSVIEDANVVPVVHAKWLTKEKEHEHYGEWYCSACGKDMLWTWAPGCGLADYCPHCGAKMDGE